METPSWFPVWGIRIRTPRLELRPVREAEAIELADLASHGVHDPATMPFSNAWTDLSTPERQRGTIAFHAGNWAGLSPRHWRLNFAAFRLADGAIVGSCEIEATEPAVRRTVTSGSWLGLAHQGQGLGKEMRAAMLTLSFECLGMQRARTAAYDDNDASLGVTRSLGYRENGDDVEVRRGEPARILHFVMDREGWGASPGRAVEVRVSGLGPEALAQLGL